MKYSSLMLFTVMFLVPFLSFSQEFDCDIKMNVDNLTAEGRENLVDFLPQLKQYFNSYKWTKEDFGDYRIRCNIEIFILGVSNNHYTAKAFIGSQRPIGNTTRNSATLRILDDKWEFDYTRSQSMNHDDFRFDPLLSFFDFYAYVILGFDFDSFKAFDGTPYFNKAMEIVNKARGSATSGSGWLSTSQSAYTRAQLMDDIFNPSNKDVRKAFYTYHYNGIDLLDVKHEKAQANIIKAIESIGKMKEQLMAQTLLMKLFFDTKYQELAESLQDYPDRSVYERIAKIDQPHQKTYEEFALKLR